MPVYDDIQHAGRHSRGPRPGTWHGGGATRGKRFAKLCIVLLFIVATGAILWKTNILHFTSISREISPSIQSSQVKTIGELRKEANSLQEHRKWSEAAQVLSRLTSLAPGDLELRRSYGVCLIRGGDQQRGITELEQVLRKGRSDAGIWHMLGHGYGSIGRNNEALDAFKKAVSLEPTDGENYRCGALFIAQTAQRDPGFRRHLPLAAQWYENAGDLGVPPDSLGQLKSLLEQHVRNGLLPRDSLAKAR